MSGLIGCVTKVKGWDTDNGMRSKGCGRPNQAEIESYSHSVVGTLISTFLFNSYDICFALCI